MILLHIILPRPARCCFWSLVRVVTSVVSKTKLHGDDDDDDDDETVTAAVDMKTFRRHGQRYTECQCENDVEPNLGHQDAKD